MEELVNVAFYAAAGNREGSAVGFSPSDVVHLTYDNGIVQHFFDESDVTVVAIFRGDNNGTDLRSSSGFVAESFGVVYPGSGIAAPGDIALLGDIPGAVAIGKGVTGSCFAAECSPAGDVGCGAAI